MWFESADLCIVLVNICFSYINLYMYIYIHTNKYNIYISRLSKVTSLNNTKYIDSDNVDDIILKITNIFNDK